MVRQQSGGDVQSKFTEDKLEEKLEEKPEFYYNNNYDNERYFSLRHLRGGQVLDFEGNVAGQIDTVIYENAEAQNIYFSLKPVLNPLNSPVRFGIPYQAVDVIENPDGYDIQLSKKQTINLAEKLYSQK